MEGPSAPPTYIFPFISPAGLLDHELRAVHVPHVPAAVLVRQQQQPTVDSNYSIANTPVFSDGDKTVTVTLKHWKWSDGEQVTSRDVEFWMNMMFAEKDNWCDYTPGYFPDNVASMSYPNSSTVVFHMKQAYNPTWFLYNELSQVTPMPMAWDVTAKGQAAPEPDRGEPA